MEKGRGREPTVPVTRVNPAEHGAAAPFWNYAADPFEVSPKPR